MFLAVYIPLPWHFVLSQSIVWKCFKLLYKVSIKIEKKPKKTPNGPTHQKREFWSILLSANPVAKGDSCFSSCLFQRQSQPGFFEAAGRTPGSQILNLGSAFGRWGWAGLGSGHKPGVNPPLAEESAWGPCKIPLFLCVLPLISCPVAA